MIKEFLRKFKQNQIIKTFKCVLFFTKFKTPMMKRMPNLYSVLFMILIVTSCGPELTPCGCADPKNLTYAERCEEYLIGAPHDVYVRFRDEMNNCTNKSEIESENESEIESENESIFKDRTSWTIEESIDNTANEETSVAGLETVVNESDQEEVSQEKWTPEDKKQWVENCIAGVNATSLSDMPLRFKKDYCFCTLDKLMMKYPNKFAILNTEIAKGFAMQCLKDAMK